MASKKRLSFLFATFIVSILFSSTAFADPFISLPGTRAKAMGGAFAAIADDVSAVWYNPAGIANEGTDFIVEAGEAASFEEDISNEESSYFIGFKKGFGNSGMAIAYYMPYKFPKMFESSMDQTINSLSLAAATSLFEGKLKIGGSLDMLFLELEGSMGNNFYRSDFDETGTGYAGSFGAQLTAIEYDPWGITAKLGAVYRTKSSSDLDGVVYQSDEIMIIERPETYDYGIAVTKSFTTFKSAFTLSWQKGHLDWESACENLVTPEGESAVEDTTSYGAEWQIAQKLGFIEAIAFRAGRYESEADYWVDTEGTTFGVGLRLPHHWGLDVTTEKREFDTIDKDDVTLASTAVTYSF